MGKQIYHTTNRIGTVMTYQKRTAQLSTKTLNENIGTCAALSSFFLKNMMESPVELTNPNQARSSVVFAGCWIRYCDKATKLITGDANIDRFNKSIMTSAGLTASAYVQHVSHVDALKYICRNPGYYYVDLREGHIVAAVNRNGEWYIFDSNNYGLWEFSTANEFFVEVSIHLKGARWTGISGAWTYSVT